MTVISVTKGIELDKRNPTLQKHPRARHVMPLRHRSYVIFGSLLSLFGVPDSKDSFHKIYLLERRGLPEG
jgi:hypothetical protein